MAGAKVERSQGVIMVIWARDDMIKRELYMQRIRPFINKPIIKVITGIRRCGKSVMLQLIQEELLAQGVEPNNIIAINLESTEWMSLSDAPDLITKIGAEAEKRSGRSYLFLDEIQEVNNWERCVNAFQVDYDMDIYITGSNAKLLSGELATYLAGRYTQITIYPFSFAEFIDSISPNQPGLNHSEFFKRYLLLGGMPFLKHLDYDEDASRQYLHDIYTSVVIKDIVKRNGIRDVDLLERIILYVLGNIGQTFSANSLSNYFKQEGRRVATETILNYLRACQDAFLFYQVPRQDLAGKKILSVQEKYYVADHGLREAVYGHNLRDISQVLENMVCMEMLRRDWHVTVGTTDKQEVDFVCERNGQFIYLQVCYLLADETTAQREFGAFSQIEDNYPRYVISMDEIDLSRNGIRHLNIRDFLLGHITT